VALQLGESLRHGAVVRFEEPAVAANKCRQTHALVRRNGYVPPRAPLVEAFTPRHQDLAAGGILPRQERLKAVRLYTTGEPELLGSAAMPARGHDAVALALGVIVAAREFTLVVVAGLADRERGRRAQHDASS